VPVAATIATREIPEPRPYCGSRTGFSYRRTDRPRLRLHQRLTLYPLRSGAAPMRSTPRVMDARRCRPNHQAPRAALARPTGWPNSSKLHYPQVTGSGGISSRVARGSTLTKDSLRSAFGWVHHPFKAADPRDHVASCRTLRAPRRVAGRELARSTGGPLSSGYVR
jgi:hypothetical protein